MITARMLITVFTPTYNRGHLLTRVYESLCRQSFKDFEWVIVDDGSEDDTQSIVSSMRNCHTRYFRQENGGKHRAINRGVREAQGELFLILDSDDSLPPDSLEWIAYYYQQVRDDKAFGGVCGYMAHHDGTIIGRGNGSEILDTNSIDMRFKYHVQGDMCEVFRTEVLRENPFPEIHGEKFVPEALVWNRIARKYKLRVFNKVVYYRDYLDGGLTDKIVKIRMNSPMASMMTYAEMTQYNIPLVQKMKAAINYWRFRFSKNTNHTNNENHPRLKWYWNWVMPVGWLMHVRDAS